MRTFHKCPSQFTCLAHVSPCRPCEASRRVVCAGRLKAADLIEFLGTHAAPAPSKGKAAEGSGEADSDEAPGGEDSGKAVPQVHSHCKLVSRVVIAAECQLRVFNVWQHGSCGATEGHRSCACQSFSAGVAAGSAGPESEGCGGAGCGGGRLAACLLPGCAVTFCS